MIWTPPGAVTLPCSRDESIFYAPTPANLFQPKHQAKVCVVYTALRIFVRLLSPGFSHLSNLLRRRRSLDAPALRPESNSKSKTVTEEPKPWELPTLPQGRLQPRSLQVHITVPIVRPAVCQEVQSLFKRRALTFDERGIKETMTVRTARWSTFVDRQCERLRQELGGAGCHPQRATPLAGGDLVEEDVEELEQLLERMEDWKDLKRYAGTSMGMAAAYRGGEMHIRVLAFEEHTDHTGIDFIRLAYRKSVEVRNWLPSPAKRPRSAASGLLSAVLPCLMASAGITEKQLEQWAELLQRPDVAKFAIALMFRSALESDGLHLDFCDPQPSDEVKS